MTSVVLPLKELSFRKIWVVSTQLWEPCENSFSSLKINWHSHTRVCRLIILIRPLQSLPLLFFHTAFLFISKNGRLTDVGVTFSFAHLHLQAVVLSATWWDTTVRTCSQWQRITQDYRGWFTLELLISQSWERWSCWSQTADESCSVAFHDTNERFEYNRRRPLMCFIFSK